MSDEQPVATGQGGLGQAQRYWDERARRGTTDSERVDQSLRAQRMRFEVFALNHPLAGHSVLDVGCGIGDLLQYFRQRGIDCVYAGVDLSAEMIRRARERFPAVPFVVGSVPDAVAGGPFDYTVSIGIHNVKVTGGWDILSASLRRQFELCTVAAHVSLLTDRYSGFDTHVQAWKAEEVLSLALSISPHVVLRHDYLPNDFSVTLYHRPLIDTMPALVLK